MISARDTMATEIGGYEYKFIDTPSDGLLCRICHLPSRDPFLSTCCGHNFCESCLDDYKRVTTFDTTTCPVCRDQGFLSVRNKLSGREIRNLHVMCANNERGCEWQGEVNDISKHIGDDDAGCPFQDVACPNICGKVLQRQYLTNHVETKCPRRKVSCQYCHILGGHQFIEVKHKEECPKFPLTCPNVCEIGDVLCEDMEAHRKECPLEMVQCKYHGVGCEEKIMRKRRKDHEEEKMEEHLSLTKYRLTDAHQELSLTKSKLADVETELAGTKSQLANSLKQINQLMVVVNQTPIPQEQNSSFRSYGSLTISALKWSVKLIAMAAMIKSGDQVCPVIVNITELSKRLTAYFSDPFYTHDEGYKMRLCVDAAGDGSGRGTRMSVFLYLMKGTHDDKVTWPLTGKFEIRLLNQMSDYDHYTRTVIFESDASAMYLRRVTNDKALPAFGSRHYICNEDLHKVTFVHNYVKDDCVFIQVNKL